jgi:hypothetical protein
MIPDQKNLTRPGSYTEIEHRQPGGINTPFIPPVENLFYLMLFTAPYKRNRFLRSLIFVAGQNLYALKLHFTAPFAVAILLLSPVFFNQTGRAVKLYKKMRAHQADEYPGVRKSKSSCRRKAGIQ